MGIPNTDELQIEAALWEDIPAMTVLLGALFGIEQDFSADVAHQRQGLEMMFERPATARIVVARSGDAIIGMATAQLLVSTAEGALSAWIEDVVVRADWQRRGIGKRLLDNALSWAARQGATRAQLLFDLDNEPADLFYRDMGWAPTRLAAKRFMLGRANAADFG